MSCEAGTVGTKRFYLKEVAGGEAIAGSEDIYIEVIENTTSPVVYSVTPTNAVLNQSTTFTVSGQNLPSTLAFWIPECEKPSSLGGTSTSRQFRCTPSWTTGWKEGEIKDYSGGTLLKVFSVNVSY